MTETEKVEISQVICSGLLRKMRADFNHNVAQSENENRLDPRYEKNKRWHTQSYYFLSVTTTASTLPLDTFALDSISLANRTSTRCSTYFATADFFL